MRLTFGLEVDRCPDCGSHMKLRVLARAPGSIERFLRHQGPWLEPRELAPARAPPYHSSVFRLQPSRKVELCFDSRAPARLKRPPRAAVFPTVARCSLARGKSPC